MKNCKGFSLAETITAFSIWSLVVILLIPQLVLITNERKHAEQSLSAHKILHEKTREAALYNQPLKNETFTKDNIHYNLTWEEEQSYKKACLFWEKINKQQTSVCFLVS